jgi:glycerate kinase
MRVLVVADKFKGTLTAAQATRAIALGWKRARKDDVLDLLPMSDGGDGFGRVMGRLLNARRLRVRTVDSAHRPHQAAWWWEPHGETAIVESATVIGLAMLPPGRFHPFLLDTTGLGNVLAAVARRGPARSLIGIGGSATNDGGFGLALSLGWRFLTTAGSEIRSWPELARCARMIPPSRPLDLGRVVVAVDVRNPLLGPHGATRIYGPQKGIQRGDIDLAEASLQRLADLVSEWRGEPLHETAGAGAAGGLGFGLMAFLHAEPRTGFSLFAEEVGLTARVRAADLVVTAEGCLDRQSLMGKGVGELVAICSAEGVPCVGVVGRSELTAEEAVGIQSIHAMTRLTSPESAMSRPGFWLSRAAELLAAEPHLQ